MAIKKKKHDFRVLDAYFNFVNARWKIPWTLQFWTFAMANDENNVEHTKPANDKCIKKIIKDNVLIVIELMNISERFVKQLRYS